MRRVVVMQRQADLLEIIAALQLPGRLPGRLDRRQQQRDQDADDGDYHQQFNERKRGFVIHDLCFLIGPSGRVLDLVARFAHTYLVTVHGSFHWIRSWGLGIGT